MNPRVLKFIKQNRVGVLSILRKDGSPHAAVLHYACDYEVSPCKFYFSTENTSRKVEALLTGKTIKAAMVIGFSEEEWITLQINGNIKGMLTPKDKAKAQGIFYAKHPGSRRYKDNPATILLEFTPTWWRYSDLNKKPLETISSDEK